MKSILIAEGHEDVAELFADLFALDGWTVTTYRDGWRAADALSGRTPNDAGLMSHRTRLEVRNYRRVFTRRLGAQDAFSSRPGRL